MSKAKILLTIGLLLIAGVVIFLLLPSSQREVPQQETQAQRVNLCGYNDAGALMWSVQACEGKMADDEGSLSGVEVVFHSDGNERLQARADTLIFKKEEATLSGEVEVIRDDGYCLHTEGITWIKSTEELTATQVKIVSGAMKVEAEEFRYDLKNERSFLEGKITAALDLSPSLLVMGNSAQEAEGKFTLTGEVSVHRGEETYRGTQIEYDQESEEVCLSGEVEGTFSSGTIRANSITLSSGKIAAAGQVHLLLDHRFFGRENGT